MTLKSVLLLAIFTLMALTTIGCQDSAVSRQPSVAEIEDATEKRLAEIDKLQIPEEQKKAMRDHIGKPKTGSENRGN